MILRTYQLKIKKLIKLAILFFQFLLKKGIYAILNIYEYHWKIGIEVSTKFTYNHDITLKFELRVICSQ